jgi:hypothetical protein
VLAVDALRVEGQHGLGWMNGEYHGQRVINDSGGTYGFASDVAFLPEADLGNVVLTNARTAGGMFLWAVQFRLFELLFHEEPKADAQLWAIEDAALAAGRLQPALSRADPAVVAAFLGRYESPVLKDVTIALRGTGWCWTRASRASSSAPASPGWGAPPSTPCTTRRYRSCRRP